MPKDEIRAVAEWLIDGARSAPLPQQILAQLCDRLVVCGIPLWRVAVFVRTLHPNIMGRRFVWRPGTEIEVREAPFELLETSDFLDSTIGQVVGNHPEADPALHSGTPLYRLRLSPCRRLTTLMRPSHPVRHFWPLRNQRFFCSRLRSGLLVERLGMQTRLTPFAFTAISFLAE